MRPPHLSAFVQMCPSGGHFFVMADFGLGGLKMDVKAPASFEEGWKKEKIWKKVLTIGEGCDIIVKHSENGPESPVPESRHKRHG